MGVRQAYSERLVEGYDRRHFGGKSGRFIFRQECKALETLLSASRGLMLDIPCGTGMYVKTFTEIEHVTVIAADASLAMLEAILRAKHFLPKSAFPP